MSEEGVITGDGELSVIGMDCKVGGLANIQAFFHAVSQGESLPASERISLSEHDRLVLKEQAAAHGVDLAGLSHAQEQILLLILGCHKNHVPKRLHLTVVYDGEGLEEEVLAAVSDELKRRAPFLDVCRLRDSRSSDPLHAVHLARRDFLMGHASSVCVLGLSGGVEAGELVLFGIAALLLKPGVEGAFAVIPFSASERKSVPQETLAGALEKRGLRPAHTLQAERPEIALKSLLLCIESVLGLMQGALVAGAAKLDVGTEGLAVFARTKTATALLFAAAPPAKRERVDTPVKSKPRPVREEDIAIIGMSGRFPGSRTIAEFWANLVEGKETISFFSPEELRASGISEQLLRDPNYVRAKPALEHTDKFDSLFFGISPREAEMLDPQQRIALEEAYRAFEDAGYCPSRVEDVGVYLSEFIDTYWVRAGLSSPFLEGTSAEQFLAVTSNDKDYLATRIAYKLGLTGPALSVQTACSSSLVAVHLACEAIRAGDVSMALAGGVSIYFPQKCGYRYQEDLIYSPDGHCRPFDHKASGTLFGEGVGMVLLKKLSSAREDRDPIYAVIKGSAINNDGNQKIDFTAPGYAGQKSVITKALSKAGLRARSIGFVEAHGTGTKMGDPLEFSALTDAFRQQSEARQYCALGSLKGNVGHLNTAAGVASLIKAVLCVKEGVIPPVVNFEKPNPQIDLPRSPFYINQRLESWTAPSHERRAGISSFGIGGTNAHMVIEGEEMLEPTAIRAADPVIFVLSAKSQRVLDAYAEKVCRFLKARPEINLRDFAYSFQIGREAFEYRLAVQATSVQGLIDTLERAKGSGSTPEFLGEIAQTWLNGGAVDWESLYPPEDRPQRLSGLPTYPFVQERHWYEAKTSAEANPAASELKSFLPVWNPVKNHFIQPLLEQRVRIAGGSPLQAEAIRQFFPQAAQLGPDDSMEHLIWIAPEQECLLHLFRTIESLIAAGYESRELVCTFLTTQGQAVLPQEEPDPWHAAVHGLVGVLAKEYPRWRVRLVDLPGNGVWPVSEIFRVPFNANGDPLAYRNGEWFAQQLLPVYEQSIQRDLYRNGGVYVVIGGSGGLGEIWTRWITENYRAQVIWVGRRPLDETIRRKLRAMPIEPLYIQADATDRGAMENALRQIKERHPQIHGVIHSTVDAFDSALADLDEARFKDILSAKIDVSITLAEVFRSESLDFVLLFSSMASFVKGGGFAGYSAGCSFMDAYAHRITRELRCPAKVANWGYWDVGSGERVSEQFKIRQQILGIDAILPEEGMSGLRTLLNGPFTQLMLLKTSKQQVLENVSLEESVKVYPETIPSTAQEPPTLQIPALEQLLAAESDEETRMDALLARMLNGILRTGFPIPLYQRWFEEASSMLRQHGYVERERLVDEVALWEEWNLQVNDPRSADKRAHYLLLETCLRALPSILTGETRATDVMFPNASLSLVEEIYKGNRVSDLFNELLGSSLIHRIQERLARDPAAKLRILEVGAGTGGTTAALLPRLQSCAANIAEYCYTDISKAFLLHAEQQFAPAHSFLRTAIFDVSSPLAGQDISPGEYDFVLATNVLHATRNIRQTLRNVKAALRANGVVLLNEISRKSLAAHLTFGLLEGWWLSEDTALRMPGGPGLYPEGWSRALEMEGFRAIQHPAEPAHALGQQIVVAESDGVIRQEKEARHEPAQLPIRETPAGVGDERLRWRGARYFKKLLGSVLKIKEADFDASVPLGQYGLDSILIGQINEKLRLQFGTVRKTLLFEAKTIDALVQYYLTNERLAFVAALGGEAVELSPPVPKPVELPREAESVSVRGEPVAIIGLSGRYADAENLEEFWENLQSGTDCVTEIPPDRWPLEGFYCEDPEEAVSRGMSYSKWGSFIPGFAEFDPLFFNITPNDARNMDPQERLFLQAAWHALEDAGYTREMLTKTYGGRVGIFAGVTRSGFELRALEHSRRTGSPFPGVSFSSVANRVSFALDLKGPSMAIDTMCSSSLTAIHEACERLRSGECALAIAGGVNLYVHPSSYVGLCAAGMLSTEGVCKSFGKESNGIVLGEGVGAVLLKPLSLALRDGDSIHAVIRGSGVNHGGRTNAYTVPNPEAQEQLIRETLDRAGIHARAVTYIEAHGTGTSLGDPIEIAGLTRAFASDTRDTGFCAIGSAKSNLGHLEAAAGIAGLTKAILQMKHGRLVPSLHADELNPLIDFETTPFVVQKQLEEWKGPRIAGISSFGAGGVNAHVLLEEFHEPELETDSETPCPIVLSAKNESRLKEVAANLAAYLPERSLRLCDVAFTLQTGREAMEERLAFVAGSLDEVVSKLRSYLSGSDDPSLFRGRLRDNREILALFSADEDIQQSIGTWFVKKKYEQLLDLWVRGLRIDWGSLNQGSRLRRLHLPLYPFARERYWFDDLTPTAAPVVKTWMGSPVWRECTICSREVRWANQTILFCDWAAELPWKNLRSSSWDIAARYTDFTLRIFDQVQRMLRTGGDSLLQVVIREEDSILRGLSGLLRTAHQEDPRFFGQIIEMSSREPLEVITAQLLEFSRVPEEPVVRYANGVREVLSWKELAELSAISPWKEDGVYWISGGAGGLGLILAKEIARHAQGARIILSGRSVLTAEKQHTIDSIGAEYRQLDVSKREEVEKAVREIGRIDGILHLAAELRDNFILRKTQSEIAAVLAPKVAGLVNLAEASKESGVSFCLCFSSIAGSLGNAGQADYAAANAFMDAYAERYSNSKCRMLSLNWPLWAEGGMQVDAITREEMRRTGGMEPMPAAAGFQAIYRALASDASQVMTMSGEPARFQQMLFERERVEKRSSMTTDRTTMKERALSKLAELFGNVIGLTSGLVDTVEPLENFGVDSIMIAKLNQRLSASFQKLPKTLFFEYATLHALADYLVDQHAADCAAWTGDGEPSNAQVTTTAHSAITRAPEPAEEPIAIIGLAAHFAQADTLDEYWEILQQGRDCIREIPSDRWTMEGFYEPDPKKAASMGKSYGKWGSFLDGFADFDPLFFSISPQEALTMDPHERLFLQASWEAMEDAGYMSERLAAVDRRVGVFVGITKVGYALHGPALARQGEHLSLHTSFSSVANRVSYILNLKGPSLPIDTMCSSSLTAIHEACEHLRRGSCAMAITGGVNLYLHPQNFVELSALQLLSEDGKCRSFGANGTGMVPGEGVGAVLLKPLSKAIADGDQIHAVIRGSNVNHGGKTNGYSVPNPKAQEDLIRETLDKAGVNARQISYVEAHGTGTSLGDPVEVDGLTRAFRKDTSDKGFCSLGSAKSNIGHLEAAAGVAGLIKIVLQMKHGQLAPSLHSRELNPNIDFGETPFHVQQELAEWKGPRIAGLSSFGAAGANAHLIIEEFIGADERPVASQPVLVVLSAKNVERLRESARRLHDYLERHESLRLDDLAYTLQVGREAMEERLAFLASSRSELLNYLQSFSAGGDGIPGLYRGQARPNRETIAALASDEEFQETVRQWLARRKYHKLLEMWVKGIAVDWSRLDRERKPRVVSLPPYPFARERYWIPEAREESLAEPSIKASVTNLLPVWDAVVLPSDTRIFPAAHDRVAVVGGSSAQFAEIQRIYPAAQQLQSDEVQGDVDHLFWIAPDAPVPSPTDEHIILQQEIGVIQVFRLVKRLLLLGYGVRDFGWTFITFGAQFVRNGDSVNPIHASVHGFVGSLAKEYPNWKIRLLDLPRDVNLSTANLWSLPPHPSGDAVAFRKSEWFAQTLLPVDGLQAEKTLYRHNGVYVMIGGAGGIGEAVSRELILKYQARVIWIGRRAEDAAIREKLNALAAIGTRPTYITADARKREELQRACDQIKGEFGAINGLYHSALGSYDQSLAEMDESQFREVLSAKVDTCVRLGQVFGSEPLDFVLFFSSLAAFGKGRGMSSYAAACTFKDAFAKQPLWRCPAKVMNWGYWSVGGGARISETLRRQLERTGGIVPIESEEGMAALQALLAGPFDQLGFVKTTGPRDALDNITVYPDAIPAVFDTLHDLRPSAILPRPHPGVDELENWMRRLVSQQFAAMGVSREGTEMAGLGVQQKHVRWWNEGLKEIASADHSISAAQVWPEWDKFRNSYSRDLEMAGPIALVDDCFRKLPEILRGEILTTDLLFPQGSMEKMEALYKDNSVSRYFNEVLAEFVASYVQQRVAASPQAQIRILEIGAGTGGTTSIVLPRLRRFAANVAEYVYTDLSHAFLVKAEERYAADYPFVTYRVCDIEKSPTDQGVEPGSYDLVIATNVLHATKSVRHTLRNVKVPLAKNGLLLMNEMSSKTVFATLLFGLIDGWSRAEDEALRIPGSPGLLPETWRRLLGEEGFDNVLLPVPEAEHLGQQIIISKSDGIVRKGIAEIAPPKIQERAPTRMSEPGLQDLAGYVREQVLQTLAKSLRMEEKNIASDISFSDYGMDSILGSNFVNQLSDRLGISLNTTIIFSYPTFDRLSNHLVEAYNDAIIPSEPAVKNAARPRESVSPVISAVKPELSGQIAVIGMSGQFPGAEDTRAFWHNLIRGVDSVELLPVHYLDLEKDYSPEKQKGKSYCRHGGVLKKRDCFDPLFFHLSPRDAMSMNLHQRLVLQESWRALEDAGYNPKSLTGTQTGVFVGCEPTGYFHETFTGASDAIVASRLSYYLDLRGPTMVVNTGCSSSGVALHTACMSLKNGDSSLALVGGVFAAIGKTALIPLSEIEMLSPTGRCRTFDVSGDGMVLSEGVGMVVLKRLEDAVRDGDSIYGVIQASGINQDGASNGITAPNGAAQEALIAEVYRRHGIDPETISYVEAHGTGTRLGDPIEVNALSHAFRKFTTKQGFCALGSVKSSVGHTAAASGVVGLIKVLLSMRHRRLPGTLHFHQLNPQIELEGSPFYICTEAREWQSDGPLTAALSSFGHSGTNVHFVIREHTQKIKAKAAPSGPMIVPISAKDGERLNEAARRLLQYLEAEPETELLHVAYTLQLGREAMSHRVAFVAGSVPELVEELAKFLNGKPIRASEMAAAWMNGNHVDWSALYGSDSPIRLHLPTYPFAQERYWVEPADPRTKVSVAETSGLLLSRPEWKDLPIPSGQTSIEERLVFTADPELAFEEVALQLFAFLQKRLREKPTVRTLVQVVGSGVGALSALLKTATQENPKLLGQLLEIEDQGSDLPAKLEISARAPWISPIKWQGDKCQMLDWSEISPAPRKPWKDQGVYLITGGLGGIGLIFAEEISASVASPVIILTGRSELTGEKRARLERFEGKVQYHRIDVADERSVTDLVRDIVLRHGKLDGILHSAGVNRDNFILRKSEAEFRSVLRPKVKGAITLDHATSEMPLDFFILFSSGAGVTGNIGQADYATANGFLDRFADERDQLVKSGRRHGRTLSINWPLWLEGGMQVDASTAAAMKKKTGMEAMPSREGLKAFYQAMGAGEAQVGVMWGNLEQIREANRQVPLPEPEAVAAEDPRDLREGTLRRLKELLGAQIELEPDRIVSHEPLERYGIDSIAITELNGRLEAIFGEISKTLFYEHQTLGELCEYFVSQYPAACAGWAGKQETGGAEPQEEIVQSMRKSCAVEPIAIIGLCGRYPHAANLKEFWQNLAAGKDCISEIPAERWPLEGFFHEQPDEAVAQRKSFGKWGGFLEGFEEFDPAFFNISPREALGMDPQERLFLQACWEVLEDAGYTRRVLESRFDRNVGVFAGITKTGYNLSVSEMKRQGKLVYPHTSFASVANRVSYFLNLRGPSMPIDTMCSSSLTAIHEACERLRRGDCAMAIAGGVNLYLHPDNYVELSALKMLSLDGKCRSFGRGGNGFVPGEGVGVVLLKPLAKAIEDRDRIHAVIRATHVNHGGKTNGYTIPNPKAQSALIREALDKAGVNARDVSYVEAHGTGTALGDPIEVSGLTQAFEKDTADKGFCALGSAKSNLGHLEAAAGIAGLTKIILQMQNRRLVPSLHAAELNPNIRFEETPFIVQQTLEEWNQSRRIAGLSSFGAGGSNAHAIIEEFVAEETFVESRLPLLIALSARTVERLRAQAQSMLQFASEELSETQMPGFAYTLQIGREAMDCRLGFVIRTKSELIDRLGAFVEGREEGLFLGQVDHEVEVSPISNSAYANGEELLKLWVQGSEVDWELWHGNLKPRRIGLPTYPFMRERFWISPVLDETKVALVAPSETVTFLSPLEKPRGVQLRAISFEAKPSPVVLAAPSQKAEPVVAKEEPKISSASAKETISERQILQSLTESLSRALYIEPDDIDVNKPFIEMGLDSIVGVEWVHAINKEFSFDMTASKVYDHPTVRKFAAYLAKALAERQPGLAEPVTPKVEHFEEVTPAAPPQPVAAPNPQSGSGRIAIVGISGRYPDAENLSDYWRNLTQGRNSVREVPAERWDVGAYYDPDRSKPGKAYCKWLGALKDIDCFDPLFFMISPGEAEGMDPQHRLFLEESYKAFADAGYSPQALSNVKCGAYMGIISYEYAFLLNKHGATVSNTGNSYAIGAARISYFLNLKGPAIPVDTACSSSLVATHLACQALRAGEVDMALAGGVSLYLSPESYVSMCASGMLSPEGQCKAFDDSADGFVPGEGVGVLILKRLEDAERDGDIIHGVIIGSGINQDGTTNGITAPSVQSQIDLEHDIYQRFGIDPASISCVETHGTGTKLGDPIELEALSTVFSERTERRNFCALGSVKSNIGHTSAAAGVAGVHKALLSMKHKLLPPTLHFKTPNRHFDFGRSPFYVNTELKPWETQGSQLRRVAVSSFGFSGTNAHLVVEEYRESQRSEASNSALYPIVLSARRADRLQEMARELRDFLLSEGNLHLQDLAYTLQIGREAMNERLAFTAESIAEVVDKLEAFREDRSDALFRGRINDKEEAPEAQLDEEAVDVLIRKQAFPQLLQFWVKGLEIDWKNLHGKTKARRISLPTYPFLRQRCWFESAPKPSGSLLLSIEELDPNRAARDFIPADFEELLARLIWGTLQSMGLFNGGSSLKEKMDAGGVIEKYEPWLAEMLAAFERYGVGPADAQDLESLWAVWEKRSREVSRDPAKRKQLPLIEACLRALPRILTGKTPAVEILFPGSSTALVESIYRDNPLSDLFNEILARSLVASMENRLAKERGIRILEIGAGTGGMTETVLPRLKPYAASIAEYCYTDISKSFLFAAEEKYSVAYPFIRTEIFDVEQALASQKIEPAGYDFVIASNVLHATRNIRRTLRNAKAALRRGGVLLLNEISSKSILGHLTFGLLDGWWSNEDEDLRIPGSPALYPEAWEKVLREEGFTRVIFPCVEAHALGQQIIVAENEGVSAVDTAKKEWLSFVESWVSRPLAPEAEGWSRRIAERERDGILVISERAEDAEAIRSVCKRVAALAQKPENLWVVRHLQAAERMNAADIRASISKAENLQVVFLLLPPEGLELAYSCIQAILQAAGATPIRLYCCYRREETDNWLAGEALAGLLKSAMLESVDHRFRTIEYELAADQVPALRLVQEWLCDETTELPPAQVPMVRYSGGSRFELLVEQVPSLEKAGKPCVFKDGATYLMVGALGPAGTLICEELGRRYGASLVIFSRRREAEVQASLIRIREAGASVIYRSVDILHRDALDQAMRSLKADGVELQGVIHMARLVSDAPIVTKSFADFESTFAAKVEGVWNIDAVTANEPLEFFLMYSSMAAFGIQGSPDYAFSAAFQNAMARYRDQQVARGLRSGRSRSICWGQWEVDGAVNPEKLPARLERLRQQGIECFDAPSAMACMEAALRGGSEVTGFLAVRDASRSLWDQPQRRTNGERLSAAIAAFERGDWTQNQFADLLDSLPDEAIDDSAQRKIVQVISGRRSAPLNGTNGNGNGHQNGNGHHNGNGNGHLTITIKSGPESQHGKSLKRLLAAAVQKVLKIGEAELDWDEPLPNYGLDSIIAMQLATTLEKELKFSVQPAWLIEFPTLNRLMDHLSRISKTKEDQSALH